MMKEGLYAAGYAENSGRGMGRPCPGAGVLPAVAALNERLNATWATDILSLLEAGQLPRLTEWYNAGGREKAAALPGLIPFEQAVYAPLYRHPRRIFGIGLNYADHAGDIGDAAPQGFPGSFFKMAETLIGPELVTPDEAPDVLQLEVQSVHNGQVYARNVVANMTHRPARLISLHSSIQGWYAGDVLSTGTPRAFPIRDGDIAECRIVGPNGFAMQPLLNPVVDLKNHPELA